MSFPGQAGLYKETVSRLAGVIGFTYVPLPTISLSQANPPTQIPRPNRLRSRRRPPPNREILRHSRRMRIPHFHHPLGVLPLIQVPLAGEFQVCECCGAARRCGAVWESVKGVGWKADFVEFDGVDVD
jgi:hypothetical protein